MTSSRRAEVQGLWCGLLGVVVFVPGAAFYADPPKANTLRLSFVTVAPEQIARGIEALARALEESP